MQRRGRRATSAWWIAEADDAGPAPFGSLRLFGLRRRGLDAVLTVALVALVVASRVAAFPASVWDQDEAYFAAAVASFDVTANHPHPPWFPLWIGMAKVVHAFGVEPARSLCLVSAFFATWMLFPLVALWSRFLRRELAVAAALLFMWSPVGWMLAGRAFSGTAATALLALSLALWLRAPSDSRGGAAAASAVLGLAVLVRPHLLLSALAVVGALVARLRRTSARAWVPFAGVLALGGAGLIVAAGGVAPLREALAAHAAYHFGALRTLPMDLARSGPVRGVGGLAAALAWAGLALVGGWKLWRLRRLRTGLVVLTAAVVPVIVVVFALSDPGHARYAVPLLALTSGLVVAGAAVLVGRAAPLAAAAALAWWALTVVPALPAYRSEVSPPLRAIPAALHDAGRRGAVVLADRTLVSFFDYLRAGGVASVPVIYDAFVVAGKVAAPPPAFSVGVFDRIHADVLAHSQEPREYSCTIPLVRELGDRRFLDVMVVDSPELRGVAKRSGPLVIVD